MWIPMVELEGLIGQKEAFLLAKHSGGIRQYVPVHPEEAAGLVATIGKAGTRALCLAFGGTWITVPNSNRAEPHKTKILDLLATGMDKREIARECGVTERYVYDLAKGLPTRKKKDSNDQWRLPI